ncbi:MAG TPA: hypothetical protein VFD84_13490 [Candidatus Binatia bacterium]|nr:hypothetical protein [Candidatus Binatia bacterium]
MRLERVVVASLLAFVTGCATLIHGPYEDVRVESDPPGANVTVSPLLSERGPGYLDPQKQYTTTTPATVRLRRDNAYRVELSKPGYKISTAKVVSAYDWLGAPELCGPCEAVGELPTYDMKGRSLPVRFAESAFYEYPRGFFRAWGRALRIFGPQALLGTAFKLQPENGGFLSNWHGLGTPVVSARLEPTGN